jgi:hypothetical protein
MDLIQLRITNYPHDQYNEVAYLVKQFPVVIEPVEDPLHPSTAEATIKLIEVDLPSDEMLEAMKFLGYLGWEVEIVG